MKLDYEQVPVPEAYRSRRKGAGKWQAAITQLAAMRPDTAIRVPIGSASTTSAYQCLSRAARKGGVRYHSSRDGDTLIVWLEVKDDKRIG